jgi:lipopolysaccharide biosynthesis regulator YciM
MDQFLVLLVPISAALGWWGAQWYYTRRYLVKHTQNLRQAYCKGLNYLLSEKTDKAIETFADLLANDVETIDTHVALGNLFRRRGEVERAIEIHEDLVGRASLTQDQRVSAQYELGVDYLRSGLYDRAELILANLADRGPYRRPALELLLHIYQQERDWQRARQCVADLNPIAAPRGETEAQFLCEMATQALHDRDLDVAERLVAEALILDPDCFRAKITQSDLLSRKGEHGQALALLQTVEATNACYLPEILRPMIRCYECLGTSKADLIDYLRNLYQRHRQDPIAICVSDLIAEQQGHSAAVEFLRDAAVSAPSLRLLRALIGHLNAADTAIETSAVHRLMEQSLDKLLQRQPRYRCTRCGFSGQELHWRCPSCRQWESTVPAV